jgi:hypothetical protein
MTLTVKMVHHPEGYAAIFNRVVETGDAIAEAVQRDAIDGAPENTGLLKSSIHKVRVSPLTWHITVGGPGIDYWYIMEFGTDKRNYIIKPRLKRALWWSELQHPVSQVTHPGIEPRPYMRPALYKKRAVFFPPTGGPAVVVDG